MIAPTDPAQLALAADTGLPRGVIAAMGRALDDERNAAASYAAVIARFGDVRPFCNIIVAEHRHIEMLLALYRHYQLPVPDMPPAEPPQDTDLSLVTLCQAGVDGEIENVRLYDEELLPLVAGHLDIHGMMQRLRNASAERHLPAFQRCVARGGAMPMGRNSRGGRGHERSGREA
jgi:hypothetical protein